MSRPNEFDIIHEFAKYADERESLLMDDLVRVVNWAIDEALKDEKGSYWNRPENQKQDPIEEKKEPSAVDRLRQLYGRTVHTEDLHKAIIELADRAGL